MAKKSDISNRIITYIYDNQTTTIEEISKDLGVSYQAVQKHLKNLSDKKIVQRGFIVNYSEINNKFYKYWISIETIYKSEREEFFENNDEYGKDYQERLCHEIIQKLMEPDWSHDLILISIDVVLSAQWDIILSLYAKDSRSVLKFITQYLRTHRSVTGTSTAWSPPVD